MDSIEESEAGRQQQVSGGDLSVSTGAEMDDGAAALSRNPSSPPAAVPQTIEDAILAAVRDSGGIPVSDLQDAVGVAWGTLYDRLERLEEQGRVEVASNDTRTVVFGDDAVIADAEEPAEALSRLQSETAREIAAVVLDGGAEDVDELVETTGHSERVCYYHVGRMIEAGLIHVRRRTRLVNLEATALLRRLHPSL